MPITPHFLLTQTPTHVQLEIRVPHVRVSAESIQVVVDDEQVLHFSSPPYLLILHFAPRCFHESAAESCATYEPTIADGTIRLALQKDRPGEWENLDLLGHLTRPRATAGTTGARWLREVQEVAATEEAESGSAIMEEDAALPAACYGFLRMYHGIYTDLTRDGLAKEMLEVPWTDNSTLLQRNAQEYRVERRSMRREMEEEKFDPDRYAQDMDVADDYVYQCAMSFDPHWKASSSDALVSQLAVLSLKEASFFTDNERQQLVSLPYPLLPKSISDDEAEGLLAGLIDLLFAYVYDHLTTAGDATVESAWTISTISASLAWLDEWLDDDTGALAAVGQSCLRRCLIYPYLRSYDFSQHCLQQVGLILGQGLRCVVRCLLQMRTILDQSELFYLGNKLFVDPYLTWLQRETQRIEQLLSRTSAEWETLIHRSWTRAHLGLDLENLERRVLDELSPQDANSSESEEESEEEDSDESSEADVMDGKSDGPEEGEDDVSASMTDTRGTIASTGVSPALLDENLGRSILASPLPDRRSLPSPVKARPLIEEVG
jgi:protein SHQ1